MDPLAHVFLPLAVAVSLRPDLFERPLHLLLGGFGLLPDADKFFGAQGAFHALPTLVPFAVLLAAAERRLTGRTTYATLASLFIVSHLLLDALDGGPAPLLYPFVDAGVGLTYPARVAFGEGLLGVAVDGPLVALRASEPRTGHQSFGFINGFGVASALAFLTIYVGRAADWGEA